MNAYQSFLDLLPNAPKVIGTVTAVTGELHTVQLLGGSYVQCQSQKQYIVNSKVFIEGDIIISSAPNNTNITITV